ncbi:hypothetical protein LTA6_002621 [Microbacterium sp. LTA6]|uniref:hypothetical protein n=1 Tax=Microbacterium sp. LTA6 TaxID=3129771 RepID=UPI00324A0657
MSTLTVEYPSRPRLSRSEELDVLRVGPLLQWFFPFAVLGEVRTDRPNSMPYGLVHVYFDAEGKPQRTLRTFLSEEGARWAAEHLYRRHQRSCRCIAVWYWTPAMVNYGPEADS